MKLKKISLFLALIAGAQPIILSSEVPTEQVAQENRSEKYLPEIQKLQAAIFKLQRRICHSDSPYYNQEVADNLNKARTFIDSNLNDGYFYTNQSKIEDVLIKSYLLSEYLIELLQRTNKGSIDDAFNKNVEDKIEDILEKFTKNNAVFAELADDYGRTTTQKLINKFEKFEAKHNLFRKTVITAGALTGIALILYKSGYFAEWDLIGNPNTSATDALIAEKLAAQALSQASVQDAAEGSKAVADAAQSSELTKKAVPAALSLAALERSGILKIVSEPLYTISITKLLEKALESGKTTAINGLNSLKRLYRKMGGTISETTANGFHGPRYTFDDVSGLEAIKQEIRNSLLEPISRGLQNDLPFSIPHGWLLKGSSRSGKSYMAEAIAGELAQLLPNVQYYGISADAIKYLGFREIIERVGSRAPCVLFIDEIDLWNLNRDSKGPNEHLNDLLINLSNLNEKQTRKPIIVIAATNLPDKLDPALRQPGRFERELEFTYPSQQERLDYLTTLLEKERINISKEELDLINNRLNNQPFEAIESCVRYARQLAGNQPPQIVHFIASIDEGIYCIKPYGLNQISDDELVTTAAYQAGKTIASLVFTPKEEITRVTILPVRPRPSSDCKNRNTIVKLGEIFLADKPKATIITKADMLNKAKVLMAGPVSQEIVLGTSTPQYREQDQMDAMDLLIKVAADGLDIESMPKKVLENLQAKAFEQYQQIKAELKEALMPYKEKIVAIALALKQAKTIDALEIPRLMLSKEEAEALQQLESMSAEEQQAYLEKQLDNMSEEERKAFLEQLSQMAGA